MAGGARWCRDQTAVSFIRNPPATAVPLPIRQRGTVMATTGQSRRLGPDGVLNAMCDDTLIWTLDERSND
jgi:hypothetical protein